MGDIGEGSRGAEGSDEGDTDPEAGTTMMLESILPEFTELARMTFTLCVADLFFECR